MEQAIINEINKKYIEATESYEVEIEEGKLNILPNCFINLAFLYWCFAFELFEFVIPNGVSEYWSNKGGNRFLKVLDLGLERFPNNLELNFWKKYFLHISYGKEFTESDCLNLIKKYNKEESVVPYFFLYSFDEIGYKEQKDKLIYEAEVMPTAKNLYIKSLLVQGAAKGGAKVVEGIYEFTAASGKTYVGQSGNIAVRLEQHIASGKLLPGTSARITEVMGGKTAREIAEQLRINRLGGIKYLENIRNPIGPTRQYLLP